MMAKLYIFTLLVILFATVDAVRINVDKRQGML